MTRLELSAEEVTKKTGELFEKLRNLAGDFVCEYRFSPESAQVITLAASAELLALCASFSNDRTMLDTVFNCIIERRSQYNKMIEQIDMSNVFCFKHRKKK
jgi:hypothetical protein